MTDGNKHNVFVDDCGGLAEAAVTFALSAIHEDTISVQSLPEGLLKEAIRERDFCIFVLDAELFPDLIVDLRDGALELAAGSTVLLLSDDETDAASCMENSSITMHVLPRDLALTGYFSAQLVAAISAARRWRELRRANAAVESSARLLGLIAHEVRIPLETLRFTQKTLLGVELSEHARKIVVSSERTAAYLCEFISNFIETARFERGAITIDTERYSLYGMVEEVIDLLWPHAKIKDIRLDFYANFDNTLMACGDKKRIRQILINTVGNAVRYSDGGRVRLFAYAGDNLTFIVRDDGVGMSPSRITEVFHANPESVVSSTGDKHAGGLGIGVALCRKFLTLMGGAIEVKSKEGVGTIVRLSLPQAPASSSTRQDQVRYAS